MDKDGGLRTLFRKHLPAIHWVSIESSLTGAGIPDANGCWAGSEFWIEYKQCSANAVAIAPFQVAFAERRARAGGWTYLAVRRINRAADELYLYSGRDVRAVHDRGLAGASPLYLGGGGPSKWNWERVEQILLKLRSIPEK